MDLKVIHPLNCDEKYFGELINLCKNRNENLFRPKTKKAKNSRIFSLEMVEIRLRQRVYINNYWKFIEDVTKAFKFIQKYFSPRSGLYTLSQDSQAEFNDKMDEFMKNRGYCCGTWHTRRTRKIQCSGNSKCSIKINSDYFRYNSYTFCDKCFSKLPNTGIMLNENSITNKADFETCFLQAEESEDFINCLKCKKQFHERCVLHIKQSGIPFFCHKCRIGEKDLKVLNISSEHIARTECDTFIENFLRKHNIPNCDNIIIRMVSNVPKNFNTKPIIAKYHNKNFGNEIKYNNCVIFAFLKLSDGTEICFFGIYFQLYGNSMCPNPNKNSVYLSYIDSVKLCYIKERTKTYQYILLGLFEYLKMKNFQKIFVWSCPPKRDVDYIFHEKPSDMKIPTKAKLSDWYQKLMKLSVDENIVESYSGIKKFADEEHWNDINNIPYFEYDLWPARLEEAIVAAEKRTKKTPENVDLMEKILLLMKVQIDGFDQQYFVIHLQTTKLPMPINPKFPKIVVCKWVSSRNNLLDMFFEHNLEYSNVRLAKFSTYVLLYRFMFELRVCIHCYKFSKYGLTTSLMCKDCAQKYRIDRSLWNVEQKEEFVIPDSSNLFRLSVPITPLLEKREQNFNHNIPKPCLKKKFKEEKVESDSVVPPKKKKYETQTTSSEMFKRQFTPMETRLKKFQIKNRTKKMIL